MVICCISDTHQQHSLLNIPDCDVVVHAGDFTRIGSIADTKSFMVWFENLPAKHKIFCSGNHDFLDYRDPVLFKEVLKEYPGITYLRDEGVTISGLKFWGRPWTPTFGSWAFMADPATPKMLKTLSIIPADTDVLLTHGPAFGLLDKLSYGASVGCQDLLLELPRFKQLKALISGHIHEAYGHVNLNGIHYVNASVLNAQYCLANKPVIIHI